MSKLVPIPRTVEDPAYRYRMPLLQTKVEGKGINVRTVLPNLIDVAKALRVPTTYILKFMGYELGSNVIEREQNNNVSAQINGQLNDNDILNTLDKFIEKFILCSRCRYPEMYLQVRDDKEVIGNCNACGQVTVIDPKHKLTAYIKKNPPKNRTEITRVDVIDAGKVEKKDRKTEAKKYTARRLINESTDELDPYSNVEAFDAINEYLNDIMPMTDDFMFDDSHTDIIYKGIKRLRLNKEKYDKVGFILFSYIFNERSFTNVKEKTTLYEQVLERHQMREFVGHELILNLAHFFFVKCATKDWTKIIPTILKAFHDEDVIDNEFLFEWFDDKLNNFFSIHHLYRKENNDKLKCVSQVFVEWLRSEEEDEDDEDEDEEDD